MADTLMHFDKAKHELALAVSVDEVKNIRDKAEACRAYAKQAGGTLIMQNHCAEIKVRAERKAGVLLGEMPRRTAAMGRPKKASDDSTLSDLDITKDESSRWQRMAAIPEEAFDDHIEEVKTKAAEGDNVHGAELTTEGILRLGRQLERDEENAHIATTPPMVAGTYRCIVIDPPWPIQKIDREVTPNQAELGYKTMPLDDIVSMTLPEEAEDGCHLYLWTTQRFLPQSFDILTGWGFKYLVTMVWHKSGGFQPVRLPQYNCEFVLLGRKSGLPFVTTKAFPCCFDGKRREHSRKPDEFYELVNRVSPAPRIDMFSREKREGFDQWGDEQTKFDE